MVDLKNSWVRFRDMPDDLMAGLPEYVRETFEAARKHGFEVELVCANAKIPDRRRAKRRFVLAADDVGRDDTGGPVAFDLTGLSRDIRACRRTFVIAGLADPKVYRTAYAAAVEDLVQGYESTLVVETRPAFVDAWVRTLTALRGGGSTAATAAGTGTSGRPASLA